MTGASLGFLNSSSCIPEKFLVSFLEVLIYGYSTDNCSENSQETIHSKNHFQTKVKLQTIGTELATIFFK